MLYCVFFCTRISMPGIVSAQRFADIISDVAGNYQQLWGQCGWTGLIGTSSQYVSVSDLNVFDKYLVFDIQADQDPAIRRNTNFPNYY